MSLNFNQPHLPLCLSDDDGEDAEKNQDSPAKEKETQAEGS